MVKYKLTYFNGMGRAELIRVMFAQAGVDYEDERITKEQWVKLKPKFPFGLPVLHIDGKPYFQSAAINSCLAEKLGFGGTNDEEKYRIVMVAMCMVDIMQPIPFLESDPEKKAERTKVAYEEKLPPLLKKLEEILGETKGDYFVSKLSSADMMWMLCAHAIEHGKKGTLCAYPKLEALQKKIESMPKISAWLQKRPKTAF